MTMDMSKVNTCDAVICAYNKDKVCHAIAITVGDGECAMCDTAMPSQKKGGVMDMVAGVGACKASDCQFNKELECSAGGIEVKMHGDHPDCGTFKEM